MDIRKAIFPGILAGSSMIILISSYLLTPNVVWASTGTKTENSEVSTQNIDSSNCNLPTSFPDSILQWCNILELYSQQNGLDERLVAAVMLQESGGNPQAYSGSGAVGLMQVMPSDGIAAGFLCGAGPCFSSRPTMEELFDPDFNISYGTAMLSSLVRKYGNERDALRAYGPMDIGYAYADIVLEIYNRYQ
jgi:soluble lytic murein transglycosylase-like protein